MRETSPQEKLAIIQTVIGSFNILMAIFISSNFFYTEKLEVIGFVIMAFNFVAFGWTTNAWGTAFKVFFTKERQEISNDQTN